MGLRMLENWKSHHKIESKYIYPFLFDEGRLADATSTHVCSYEAPSESLYMSSVLIGRKFSGKHEYVSMLDESSMLDEFS